MRLKNNKELEIYANNQESWGDHKESFLNMRIYSEEAHYSHNFELTFIETKELITKLLRGFADMSKFIDSIEDDEKKSDIKINGYFTK